LRRHHNLYLVVYKLWMPINIIYLIVRLTWLNILGDLLWMILINH
jgi:hypothetical protein